MRIIQISTSRPGLKAKLLFALILLLGCTIVALAALLAFSILLVGLPLLVFGGLVYALLPKKRPARPPQRPRDPDVLEGRYRVVQGKNNSDPDLNQRQ
jgi:hypothetical protein